MRPLDVENGHSLDSTTPQTTKFYRDAVEKLIGDAFDGTLLFAWLIIDARWRAQSSEMFFCFLKNSITTKLYTQSIY